ncbi:acylamino-acid-releasing enzyme [Silurus meridionalis]|nr:acylamino-acid-releasing enzyme [Silurus meridionalis]
MAKTCPWMSGTRFYTYTSLEWATRPPPCSLVMTSPEEIAKLYREQSHFPSLSRADVGPLITSQYGGKYNNIYTGGFPIKL